MAIKESMTIDDENRFAEIPQPPSKLLVGNLLDIVSETPVQAMIKLAREYGPIFRLDIAGRQRVIVSGFELVNELADESRFDKKVWAPLKKVRTFAGDGLFTAKTQEPNWRKAHNILLPNFSMRAMQGYFPMMLDIAEQLMVKWARMNADDEIDVAGDMTRLTLDTIGLCGFDYRFNSFYREDMHPFVQSMVRALGESMDSLQRLPVQEKLMVHKHRQMRTDIDFMNGMVDRIIQERRRSGEQDAKNDLLQHMLNGVDKETGERLDDTNIRYQIITFLIAGHETTSGLLSFALYFLLNHPEVLAGAYEEVDRVLGPDPSLAPTFAQVNRLKYVSQILKETLRLWPTAPLFAVYPYEGETVLGGTYKIGASEDVSILIPMLHRDKSVWGEDAEEFNPDRFTVEAEQARPANAYKPFGNGQRACIGRQFAMQEATLVLGMILQRFKLIDHAHYQLKVKETLTLKPDGFKMRVKERTDADRSGVVFQKPVSTPVMTPDVVTTPVVVNQHHTPLLVLFGSNLGTAEDIAQHIAEDGKARGFDAMVAPLDDYVNTCPKAGALVVVSASYNGAPPDNAGKFCAWIKDSKLAADALKGVRYTVFGCGNREWASTFQAIPRLLDEGLERHGAQRIYARGEGDASDDFDGEFQAWYRPLWDALAQAFSLDLAGHTAAQQKPMYEIEMLTGAQPLNPFVASFGARVMHVAENRELHCKDGSVPSERSTRHIELELPAGVTYRAGDHLGVMASNSAAQVRRVAAHFGFDHESKLILHRSDQRKTHLPVEKPVLVFDLLADYVELQDVATRTQIRVMAERTQCPPDRKKLQALASDDETKDASLGGLSYRGEVLAKRKSLIDLLEEFPACELPFNVYLELLAPIRPRYYSISSSPLQESARCSVTVSVVKAPAKSGHGDFEGLCSNYLAGKAQGDSVYAFVRNTNSPFYLPADARTPLIMVGPGTGLAPYRGFLQERAALKAQGIPVGPSLLFFGCRHPQQDYIYEQELRSFVEQGVTELAVAFSRQDEHRKVYVQDKIWEQRDTVWQLLQENAIIYVCGDAGQMVPDVQRAFAAIYQEKTDKTARVVEQWLSELVAEKRYLTDVWGN